MDSCWRTIRANPLVAALVRIVETGQVEITHSDGTFHLEDLKPGKYTIRVTRLGYRTVTKKVEVGQGTSRMKIRLKISPLRTAEIVVTGSLIPRSVDETLRSVNVLAGEELLKRLQGTVAATLKLQPGMAVTSMGPATARPVIRGLSGDRVLVLEDGERVGDVSNRGSDHATALDPSTARRIEVVRGPAALLYGSNALGGVVNVIRDEVPRPVPDRFTGAATLEGRSVNAGFGGSLWGRMPLTRHIPLRIELSGRTAGDPDAGLGLDTWEASAGSAWAGHRGSLGGAVRYYRNRYGIPGGFVGGHAEGVRVEMERRSAKVRATWDLPLGLRVPAGQRGLYVVPSRRDRVGRHPRHALRTAGGER